MVDRRAESGPFRGGSRNEIVTKLSPWSVSDTVARLSAIAAARRMRLFAEIDHSGEAEARGLELRDMTLVIFGDPATYTSIMQAKPESGLELPLKVLVWSEDHQTKVSYLSPTGLAVRYGLKNQLASELEIISEVVDHVIDG
jgi:uncharacterized protein (DUF302 family)